jgi:hypothetical protein
MDDNDCLGCTIVEGLVEAEYELRKLAPDGVDEADAPVWMCNMCSKVYRRRVIEADS